MPIYEYKGVHYDLQETNVETAKHKIRTHLKEPGTETAGDALDWVAGAVKPAIAQIGNQADTALSTLSGSLAGVFGDTKEALSIEENRKDRAATRNQWANPTGRPLSFGEKAVGLAATLPMQIAGSGLSPADTADKLKEAGESNAKALAGAGIDAAGNVVGMILPGWKEGSTAVRALTGFGANAAQDVVTKKAIQTIADTEQGKKTFQPTLEDATLAGVMGGTTAVVAGRGKTAPTQDPTIKTIADQIKEKKVAKRIDVVLPEGEAINGGKPLPVDAEGNIGEKDLGTRIAMEQQRVALEAELNSKLPLKNLTALEDANKQQSLWDIDETVQPGQKYQAEAGDWRIDENGMPIRVDLSLDAQHAQNMLQRDMFVDEVPAFAKMQETGKYDPKTGELIPGETKSIAASLDDLDWAHKRGALNKTQLGRETPASGPLEAAKLAAENTLWAERPITSGSKYSRQRGALDTSVIKEGYRGIARALSALTDQPWVKARFPADSYESNSDETPRVWLHGTTKEIVGPLKGMTQGIHLGGPTSSHFFVQGRYRGSNLSRNGKGIYSEERTKPNAQLYPMVIRKGNYPTLPFDTGNWNPKTVLDNGQFRRFLDVALANKGYDYDQIESFYNFVKNGTGTKDTNDRMTSILRRAGIDGFYYKNTAESVRTERLAALADREAPMEKLNREGKVLQHPISFVTWDDRMVKSIYDDAPVEAPKKVMHSSQRGSVSTDALTLGLVRLFGNKKPPVITEVPGLKQLLPELSEVANTPEGVVEAAKAFGKDVDRGVVGNSIGLFTKGFLYEKMKTNNPVIKYTYDRLSAAKDAAKLQVQELLQKDIVPKMRDLSPEEKATIWADQVLAMHEKVDLTPEMLIKAGYNNKQIRYFEAVQRGYKEALVKLNESRAAIGKDPLDAYTGYIAGLSSGNFRKMLFQKGTKNPVGIIGSDFRALLDKRVTEYLKNNPDVEAGPEVYSGYAGSKREGASSLMDALMLLSDNDPNVKAFMETYKAQLATEANQFRGANKHTMNKKGIIGMEGDQPWKSAENNALDGMNAQVRYIEKMLAWAETTAAIADLKKVFGNEEVVQKMPNAVKMAEDYTHSFMGNNPTLIGSAINHLIGKIGQELGVGPSLATKSTAGVRNLVNTTFFALNQAFLATNYLQPLISTPAIRQFLAGRGINPDSIDVTGYSFLTKGSLSGIKEITRAMTGEPRTGFDKAMWEYADKHGISHTQIIDHTHQISKGLQYTGSKALEFGMNAAEAGPRSVVYAAFAHMLKDAGYGKDAELFSMARQLTDMTMTDYRSHEQIPLVRHMGPFGIMTANLQAFHANELSKYAMLFRELSKSHSGRGIVAALTTGIIFNGLMGTIGFEEANWMVDQLSKLLVEKPLSMSKVILDWADKQGKLGDVAALGIPSLLGVDMHSRTGTPKALPTFSGGFEKVGSIATEAAKTVVNPTNEMQWKRLAREVSPGGIAGLEDVEWFSQKTPDGKEIPLNRKTLEPSGEVRTDADKLWKRLGFTGSNEFKKKEQNWQNVQADKYHTEKRKAILDRLTDETVSSKGPIPTKVLEEALAKYSKHEGDPEKLVNEWIESGVARNITPRMKMIIQMSQGRMNPQKMQRQYTQ